MVADGWRLEEERLDGQFSQTKISHSMGSTDENVQDGLCNKTGLPMVVPMDGLRSTVLWER